MNVRTVVSKGLLVAAVSGGFAAVPLTMDGAAPAARADTVNWDAIAQCESGGKWSINTGNGHFGGLQFKQATWSANGGAGNPAAAPRHEQIRVAENVLRTQGLKAWPKCGVKGAAAQVWGSPAPAPASAPATATGCATMPTSVFGGIIDLRKMCSALLTPRQGR